MSTKSYVFKPDASTLLPLTFDPKITSSTVPILQTCGGYKKWYGISWERVIEGF